MQINGEWFLGRDGITRPVIHGLILAGNGAQVSAPFLVDTGADGTVISATVFAALRLQPIAEQERLRGLGGLTRAVVVETQLRFRREAGNGTVVFRGQYAAVTELEALDISVLGRDITGLFAVIVDQPGNVVCLLGQRHRYTIVQQ
jgi:predicted aspartyl protease